MFQNSHHRSRSGAPWNRTTTITLKNVLMRFAITFAVDWQRRVPKDVLTRCSICCIVSNMLQRDSLGIPILCKAILATECTILSQKNLASLLHKIKGLRCIWTMSQSNLLLIAWYESRCYFLLLCWSIWRSSLDSAHWRISHATILLIKLKPASIRLMARRSLTRQPFSFFSIIVLTEYCHSFGE